MDYILVYSIGFKLIWNFVIKLLWVLVCLSCFVLFVFGCFDLGITPSGAHGLLPALCIGQKGTKDQTPVGPVIARFLLRCIFLWPCQYLFHTIHSFFFISLYNPISIYT